MEPNNKEIKRRSTFSLLFYINRTKVRKDGTCKLLCKVSIDAKSAPININAFVEPSLWNPETKRANGRSENARTVNLAIEKLTEKITGHYRHIRKSLGFVTAELVKNAVEGIGQKPFTLLALFREHNEEFRKRVYGNIASDPRLAAMNFIHALATIEPTLEKFRKKNEELEKDIPVLREVVESSWRKEPELTALKTDLTEIDRRIQQSLKPIEESEGKEAEEDNDVCRERHDTAEELPKEDNTAARIPSRLRQIADASGGRIVIAGVGSPPENGPAKKGIKM